MRVGRKSENGAPVFTYFVPYYTHDYPSLVLL